MLASCSQRETERRPAAARRFCAGAQLAALAGVVFAATAETRAAEGAVRTRVVTSFYPIYLHTLNVAQGVPGVQVENLTPPQTGCLHEYQLRPSDFVKLNQAAALIVNGGGMESFLDTVLRRLPALKVIRASDGIELLQEGGTVNPHVWLSVPLAIRQVRNITAGLAALDPDHAAAYRANGEGYIRRLEALKDRMHAELAGLPRRSMVTFHEAFPYFAREFGLDVAAVIAREPGSVPSARELAETIKAVRQKGVPALFTEPQYPAAAAEAIARETGARLYVLDPVVTGPDEPDAYLNAMERNARTLKAALSQ